ncbi:MAG TPA: methyl-accepting chemotaxis protein [Caulobacteraceae bacterium]|jgi:uncharacterized protein YukE
MQEDILKLAYEVSRVTEEKVELIDSVMRQTHLLAINARIEAARAGTAGAAFSVVAQEMGQVATEISRISKDLRAAVGANIDKLEQAGAEMMTRFKGARLTDLAHNAVEIIDRNLYERSCDVRWWATDSAVVDVLERPSAQSAACASERLATILRSYTVYLDLWVADAQGKVVTSGRPGTYRNVQGLDVSDTDWFRKAMRTASGEDFTVADIETNRELGGAAVATYATAIRQGARNEGQPLGVLGIFFDWRPQAEAVVTGVSLSEEERRTTRVMLLDARCRVIASSDGRGLLQETYPLETQGSSRGHYAANGALTAFALTPGYETYEGLGWYGVIESRAEGIAHSSRAA